MMARWLGIFLFLLIPASGQAEKEGILNKLLAPGPLIKGHANLEGSQCLKCHESGQGVPDQKCIDCHLEIESFVKAKKGFHGLTTQKCFQCHADHKGRDFNTMAVDEKKFDHANLTGYRLEGKHAEIKCADCHREKRGQKSVVPNSTKYIGKISTCISCHKKDDVHFFKGSFAKKDCNECHSLKTWKTEIRFDHKKDTKFPLEGHHAEMKCNDCHKADKKTFRYEWRDLKQKQCLSCHQDIHKNRLSPKFQGGQCTTCHDQNAWKIESFDHDVTKYSLRGKHKEITCTECHKQETKFQKSLDRRDKVDKVDKVDKKLFNWTGLKTDCLSCHEDFHRFGPRPQGQIKNLNKCSQCHSEDKWKNIHHFEHNKNTNYKIDGRHLELKCQDCHLGGKDLPKAKWPKVGTYHWNQLDSKTCNACHKNPHIGEFSKEVLQKKCDSCHVTEDWYVMKSGQGFNHSKTRFPLDGAHEKVRCNDCHGEKGKQVFKFKSNATGFCIDCHQNIHTSQFSKAFSAQNCTECHSTKNFTDRKEFNHSQTRYELKGAHRDLQCSACHKPTSSLMNLQKPNFNSKLPPRSETKVFAKFLFPDMKAGECLACHQDIHKGQLSTKCLDCHNDKKWKPVQFDHNKQSQYPLTDKHAVVKCISCHAPIPRVFVNVGKTPVPVVRYKPVSKMCVDCHKDAHNGNLGKQCQECHTIRGWKTVKDFHRNFSLNGVHFTLECAECHKDGRQLAGLSQQCISCHQKDDVHSGSLPNCRDCHRQHFWEMTSFRHSLSRFPLRGAHRTLECNDCHSAGTYQGLSNNCSSCHLSEAQNATSFSHSPIGNYMTCNDCHRNQFSFQSVGP